MKYINLVKFVNTFLCVLALPSCSTLSSFIKTYRPDDLYSSPVAQKGDDFYRSNGSVNVQGTTFNDLLKKASVRGGEAARNKLIGRCMLASEQLASDHISKIPALQSAGNVGLGTAANLASGLATTFNPASTKTALAATSTLFGASRELFNNEVYYNALAPIIVKKIVEDRKSRRGAIEAKLTKRIDEYPVHVALADVAAYHEASSFYHGISQTIADASRTDGFTEKLRQLQSLRAAGMKEEDFEAQLKELGKSINNQSKNS